MIADRETNVRCGLAALAVLTRELGDTPCPPAQAHRLRRLVETARDHVVELLGEDDVVPVSLSDAPAKAPFSKTDDRLHFDVTAAWRAAAALRAANSPEDAEMHRSDLRRIMNSAGNARVRRLCADALSI
ncbi:hypothetical protein ACO2RV_14570 [Ancylobacter sp. VNQ12]|uniref:hypothetical protein n=1 Tax=Ancylobacter sp. VNQ12 TaxID=3400920 RepID=UPI003BFC2224